MGDALELKKWNKITFLGNAQTSKKKVGSINCPTFFLRFSFSSSFKNLLSGFKVVLGDETILRSFLSQALTFLASQNISTRETNLTPPSSGSQKTSILARFLLKLPSMAISPFRRLHEVSRSKPQYNGYLAVLQSDFEVLLNSPSAALWSDVQMPV